MKETSPIPISEGDYRDEINAESDLGNVQLANNLINYQTPVLFSTNRGLFLRKTKPCDNNLLQSFLSKSSSGVESGSNSGRLDKYDIQFCDLERWSTNRANTITLDDTIASSNTFTINDNTQRRSVRFTMENK